MDRKITDNGSTDHHPGYFNRTKSESIIKYSFRSAENYFRQMVLSFDLEFYSILLNILLT